MKCFGVKWEISESFQMRQTRTPCFSAIKTKRKVSAGPSGWNKDEKGKSAELHRLKELSKEKIILRDKCDDIYQDPNLAHLQAQQQ